ncbi:hypothetical protein DBR23_03695, partial [Acidovorax sp. HMWF018]
WRRGAYWARQDRMFSLRTAFLASDPRLETPLRWLHGKGYWAWLRPMSLLRPPQALTVVRASLPLWVRGGRLQ